MSDDQAYCACLNVVYKPECREDGSMVERWVCALCDEHRFVRETRMMTGRRPMSDIPQELREKAQACIDAMPQSERRDLVDAEEVIAGYNGWNKLRDAIAQALYDERKRALKTRRACPECHSTIEYCSDCGAHLLSDDKEGYFNAE